LEGFRGYPPTTGGQRRFAEALQLNVLSVEHLEATLQTFDDDFPTVRQIHDVALNLRPRFEPKEDLTEKWREEYGNPQTFKYPADVMAMHWQAFRDLLYYTEGPGAGPVTHEQAMRGYWGQAMKRALDPEWGNHGETLDFIRKQAREMGWSKIMELTASPAPFPYTNPLHARKQIKGFVTPGAIITQSDIDRAKHEIDRTAQQADNSDPASESETWSDPDR